jgi:hypothetical protein
MLDKILLEHANESRNDGMLHFSSALQNDRHAVLGYVHGYPQSDKPWGEVAQLITGTAIHEYLHQLYDMRDDKIKQYYAEIELSPTFVNGFQWTGTADAVLVDSEDQAWLVDYKTTSSNTFEYLNGKPKPEHILQVSAYYHFLPEHLTEDAKCGIMYIPVSPTFSRKWAEPAFMEFDPVPADDIISIMERVGDSIKEYKITDYLPPVLEGEWSWRYDKRSKKWKFGYKPHWSTRYCPWASLLDDPCLCSESKSIDGGTWNPETNEYDLTLDGKEYVDYVTKPWELDDSEKV